MVRSRHSWPVLPALVLLSCAGLVGLLGFNLWSTLQVAESQAALHARRQADFTAVALRAFLRHPDLVAAAPETARFSVERGAVVVPPSVGWLRAPHLPRREDLDALIRDKLDRLQDVDLQNLEPADVELDAAAARLQALATDPATPEPHRQWLRARAAWWAHRHGRPDDRARHLAELDRIHGGAAPVATLLLHAEIDAHLPPWAASRVPLLPDPLATALLDRLADHRVPADTLDALAAKLAQVRAHRDTLRRVGTLLPTLRGAPDVVVRRVDDALLVFHGAVDDTGRGALLEWARLRELIARLAPAAWANLPPGTLASLTDAPAPDSVDVVPGFLAVQPLAPRAPRSLGGPLGGALLASALAALTAAGMWLFFRSVRREADAARVRSEFLTMVTHELKTPLAGIRLLAEMLQDGHVLTRDQQQDYYHRLTSESVRLSMLIENVLDLGRMERGERAYDRRPFDLDGLVAEAVELFGPIAERAGLRVALTTDGPAPVDGDRNAILQSLLNLLDNARKYAAQGHRLDIDVHTDRGHCAVAIRDHGPGIAPEERETVFARFERGARHRDGSTPGVGLGLYLSRILVRDHGGELSVAAPADGGPGAVFELKLPVRLTDATALPQSPPEEPRGREKSA